MLDHKLKLGGGSFTLAAGADRQLALKLSKKSRHKLGHHHTVKLQLTVVRTDGTGAPVTFTQTIKLKA